VRTVEPVLDRYTEALGIELVVAVEDVINGSFFQSRFRWARATFDADRQRNFDRPIHLPFGSNDHATVGALRDFGDQLHVLYQTFASVAENPVIVPDVLWTHVPPDWGVSRYDGEITRSHVVPMGTTLPT
jgi:hypothetical protein